MLIEILCTTCRSALEGSIDQQGNCLVEMCEKCLEADKKAAEDQAYQKGHDDGYEEGGQ